MQNISLLQLLKLLAARANAAPSDGENKSAPNPGRNENAAPSARPDEAESPKKENSGMPPAFFPKQATMSDSSASPTVEKSADAYTRFVEKHDSAVRRTKQDS